MWPLILAALFGLRAYATDFQFYRDVSWGTGYGLVFVKGSIKKRVDLRGPVFSGFLGNFENWNLGSLVGKSDHCELRTPFARYDRKWESFSGKLLQLPQGARLESVDLAQTGLGNSFQEDSDANFDAIGAFSLDMFDFTPRTERFPSQLIIKIRCRGDKDLGRAMSKHMREVGGLY